MFHDVIGMIDYAVGVAIGNSVIGWIFKDRDNKFIQKMKKGITLYKKQVVNQFKFNFKRIVKTLRVTSLRDFTNTRN